MGLDQRGVRGVRRHPRYRVDALADVAGMDVLLYHPINDISMGGMRIATASRENIGSRVGVVLTFPEQEETVVLSGEVVWTAPEPLCEVGIRWRFPDASSRLKLSSCLDRSCLLEIGSGRVVDEADRTDTAPIWLPPG